jgi:DNA-binding CsgD family transcriptional regulator
VPLTVRPDDREPLRAAVREVHARSGLEVGFGGLVPRDRADGGAAGRAARRADRAPAAPRGPAGAGLGGRVLAERRPASVDDYRDARGITHDYDGPVLAEGLCTVAAVPVLVAGAPRAVLYAASRETGSVGDRVRDAMASAAARMAVELAIRDEVDRRLGLLADAGARAEVGTSRWEEIRAVHAELRLLAQTTTDDAARDRLLTACGRLASLSADAPAGDGDPGRPAVRRELDVLALVALGCSNREAAARLSLRPETVKSYLAAAMAKLDAHTRLEAVVRARRLGLLP